MKNPMRLSRWLMWAAAAGVTLAASFVAGFSWGFPGSAWHRMAAAAACGIVALLLIGMVAQVAADCRAIRRHEESELRREIERNAERYEQSSREGLRER